MTFAAVESASTSKLNIEWNTTARLKLQMTPQIKSFLFLRIYGTKFAINTVVMLCIRPELNPLIMANRKLADEICCISMIIFSNIANPTPVANATVTIDFSSSEKKKA